jgi:hypothetical protein
LARFRSAQPTEAHDLPVDEFLRRFLSRLLPEGFVRIRNFGFLANRKQANSVPLCFQLLAAKHPQARQNTPSSPDSRDSWPCPNCGGPMVLIERLTEIQLRSPPIATAAA